jgi:hypothetical protein
VIESTAIPKEEGQYELNCATRADRSLNPTKPARYKHSYARQFGVHYEPIVPCTSYRQQWSSVFSICGLLGLPRRYVKTYICCVTPCGDNWHRDFRSDRQCVGSVCQNVLSKSRLKKHQHAFLEKLIEPLKMQGLAKRELESPTLEIRSSHLDKDWAYVVRWGPSAQLEFDISCSFNAPTPQGVAGRIEIRTTENVSVHTPYTLRDLAKTRHVSISLVCVCCDALSEVAAGGQNSKLPLKIRPRISDPEIGTLPRHDWSHRDKLPAEMTSEYQHKGVLASQGRKHMAYLLEITSTEVCRQIQRQHSPLVGVMQAGCFQTQDRVNSSEAIIFTRLASSSNMCSAATIRRFLGPTGVQSCKHPPRQNATLGLFVERKNVFSTELLRSVPSLCISLGGGVSCQQCLFLRSAGMVVRQNVVMG